MMAEPTVNIFMLGPRNNGELLRCKGWSFVEHMQNDFRHFHKPIDDLILEVRKILDPESSLGASFYTEITRENIFDYIGDFLDHHLKIDFETAKSLHLHDVLFPSFFNANSKLEEHLISVLEQANLAFYVVTRKWWEKNELELVLEPFDRDQIHNLSESVKQSWD